MLGASAGHKKKVRKSTGCHIERPFQDIELSKLTVSALELLNDIKTFQEE